MGLALVSLLSACSSEGPAAPPPDLFLFTVDTVRADHLEAYGYGRPTAPWIDRVAREGVVFDAASATSSWTVPSVGSLLTGMLPHQLGTERAPSLPTPDARRPMLPSTALTLAERLGRAGYRTYAVTANEQLAAELGYAQGFDRYVNVGFASADAVEAAIEDLVPEVLGGTGPVFVWVHLFDPHDPYEPQSEWLDHEVPAWRAYEASAGVRGRAPLGSEPMTALRERVDVRHRGDGTRQLEALYDSEIERADRALELIAAQLDVGDDDVLVVSSDHGEEFRDHGELGHRMWLYEETLRVPLVVRWKGHVSPGRVTERVSLAAVTPTLAELGGVPVGANSGIPYASLVPRLEGRARDPGGPPVIAELVRTNGRTWFRAIYDGPRKLVVGDELSMLYDLSADPLEQADLASTYPGTRDQLAKHLDRFLRALPVLRPEVQQDAPPPAVVQQLEALGYLEPPGDEL